MLLDRRVSVRIGALLALSTACDIKRKDSVPRDWSHFLDPLLQQLLQQVSTDPDDTCRVLCTEILHQLRGIFSEEELRLFAQQ